MKHSQKKFQTEPALLNIYRGLVRDLSPNVSWHSTYGEYYGPRYENAGPYTFKCLYQLEHFYKRVLTSRDPSFEQLKVESFKGFIKSQQDFGLPELTRRSALVADRARKICSDILGEFDIEKFFELCSFGKRAAVNLPYRRSYLDVRVRTLNGSPSQIEWIKAACCKDIHLHRALRHGLKQVEVCESLDLQAVPKSRKSARIIAPDTTIGGFLSRGLGLLIRQRLENGTHIALSRQQDRHRILANQASIDGYLATIDMSKASDSFVWEHVLELVPESWHDILKTVRTDNVCIPEKDCDAVGQRVVKVKSYMLMGSGHTFPLQTVLFYSIVKAVLELMGSSGKCDVYGDDIIFPSRFADHVIASLHDLGFTVNVDKSFIDGPFRESCGGDYHTGVDVRPFMPEHVCAELSKHAYTECLHKWYNGLIARWTPEEIPTAVTFILNELIRLWGNICPVPEDETETAGIKYVPFGFESFVRKPKYEHGLVHYLKLTRRTPRRKPRDERGYYWYWFRCKVHDFPVDPYVDEGTPLLDQNGQEAAKGRPARYRWVVK